MYQHTHCSLQDNLELTVCPMFTVPNVLVGSVVLLSGLAGALSLPAIVLLLCTLFPTTPCEGLAFTYTLPYLASVVATLGTCP